MMSNNFNFFEKYLKPKLISICFGLFIIIFVASCSNNEDQEKFEDEAFNSPVENFTETGPNGNIIDEDPDDWRVSPFFAGLVEVEPAYPNPVKSTNKFIIQIDVKSIEAINGIEIVTLDEQQNFRNLAINTESPLPPGFHEFEIDPIGFTNTGVRANTPGLHRVFIFDLNNNMLTYGDIMVE